MSKENRRSDRILLTIPLSVEGTDDKGRSFQVEAQTTVINRHGGRIRVKHRLRAGETVRIINLMGRRSSEFRVVGLVSPYSDNGGEYGVASLNNSEDIWGIQFPPHRDGEPEEADALLACRKCGQVSRLPVSLVEVEVLQTSGMLRLRCDSCKSITSWSYAKTPPANQELPGQGIPEHVDPLSVVPSGKERRRYNRVSLRLPVKICDYEGGVEITKSENISKGGFCFVSEKDYQIGEGILVTCPYHSTGENIEVRARVVSRLEVCGSVGKTYGVQFMELNR